MDTVIPVLMTLSVVLGGIYVWFAYAVPAFKRIRLRKLIAENNSHPYRQALEDLLEELSRLGDDIDAWGRTYDSVDSLTKPQRRSYETFRRMSWYHTFHHRITLLGIRVMSWELSGTKEEVARIRESIGVFRDTWLAPPETGEEKA